MWETIRDNKCFELNNLPAIYFDDTDVWGGHAGHISWSRLIVLGIDTVIVIYMLYELCHQGVIGTPPWASHSRGSAERDICPFALRARKKPESQLPSIPTRCGLPAAWQYMHSES